MEIVFGGGDAARHVLDWLLILALGLGAGAAGQLVRVVIGLKKAGEAAARGNRLLADVFDAPKLWISLMLGALAGMVAAIGIVPAGLQLTREAVLGLLAAGYTGSDFIEGALQRAAPANPRRD